MSHVDPKNIKIILPLNAMNDSNGNPRHFLVFFNEKGEILDVTKYSYMAKEQAIRHFYPTAEGYALLPEIITPNKEAEGWYKWHNQDPNSIAKREKAWTTINKNLETLKAKMNRD